MATDMTYDQATIEKAARLLCEKWYPNDPPDGRALFVARKFITSNPRSFNDNDQADIEEALRRAVEES